MLNDLGVEIDNELLNSFLDESSEVIENLKEFVSSFKEVSDNQNFEKFGQQVDRIMGAAYTLSLTQVGELAKLGKEVGYKSSQIEEIGKLLTIQSILSQLVRTLESIFKGLKREQRPDGNEFRPLLIKLQKASEQLGDLRTTVKV